MSYIDTSVLTAYYCPEPRSSRAQKILQRIQAPAISPLVEVELRCAVARKVRARELQASDGRRIFAEFEMHLAEQRFAVLPLRNTEYTLARQWIEELSVPLRALDALHLAIAFGHGLQLVTADQTLAASARHFGVKHKLVS